MMNKKFVKIMCIFLAILMFGSVMVAAITSFALEPQTMVIANTGDGNGSHVALIVVIIAVVVLLAVTVVPMIVKKIKQ